MVMSDKWEDVWGNQDKTLRDKGHSEEYIQGYHDALETFYKTSKAFFGRT